MSLGLSIWNTWEGRTKGVLEAAADDEIQRGQARGNRGERSTSLPKATIQEVNSLGAGCKHLPLMGVLDYGPEDNI